MRRRHDGLAESAISPIGMGLGGRVAMGHGNKYWCLTDSRLAALGKRLADSGVAVSVLPTTDFVHERTGPYGARRHPPGIADATHSGAGANLLHCDKRRLESVHALRRLLARAHRRPVRQCRAARHRPDLSECLAMVTDRPCAHSAQKGLRRRHRQSRGPRRMESKSPG